MSDAAASMERARAAFVHACRFVSAHELIKLRNEFRGAGVQLIAPMLALEAFAIELLLKSLLLSEGTEPGKTHELARLFRNLHPNTKRKIVDLWDAGPRIQLEAFCKQKGFPSDLPNALVTCGKAFEDLRYAHEDPNRPIFYLGALPRLLQDHISLTHSDWVHWVERD